MGEEAFEAQGHEEAIKRTVANREVVEESVPLSQNSQMT